MVEEKMTEHMQLCRYRSAELPFYCAPFLFFFLEWALMLCTLTLHISYSTYPTMGMGMLLLTIASLSFVAGFWSLRFASVAVGYSATQCSHYLVDMRRLRRFHLVSVVVVLGIMLMNLKLHGLPPLFGFFGADTMDYQDYGSLRQPLFAAVLVLFVSAPLEKSFWRRWALYLFSPVCLLIYVSRGYLLIMLFQALAVFSLRTQLSRAKIYAVSGLTLATAVLASNFIGNGRNSLGVEALLGYLQIRPAYHDWPAAFLWVISYISTPISNMCWIVRVYPYSHPSFNFLYSALPGFWSSLTIEQVGDLGSQKIIDGVHTYMAKYFIDFWYFGIIGINYVWGLLAAFLQTGNRLTHRFLTSAVLLGCLAFIFFSDFLTILIVLLELAVMAALQTWVIHPLDSEQTRAT